MSSADFGVGVRFPSEAHALRLADFDPVRHIIVVTELRIDSSPKNGDSIRPTGERVSAPGGIRTHVIRLRRPVPESKLDYERSGVPKGPPPSTLRTPAVRQSLSAGP